MANRNFEYFSVIGNVRVGQGIFKAIDIDIDVQSKPFYKKPYIFYIRAKPGGNSASYLIWSKNFGVPTVFTRSNSFTAAIIAFRLRTSRTFDGFVRLIIR